MIRRLAGAVFAFIGFQLFGVFGSQDETRGHQVGPTVHLPDRWYERLWQGGDQSQANQHGLIFAAVLVLVGALMVIWPKMAKGSK